MSDIKDFTSSQISSFLSFPTTNDLGSELAQMFFSENQIEFFLIGKKKGKLCSSLARDFINDQKLSFYVMKMIGSGFGKPWGILRCSFSTGIFGRIDSPPKRT